MQTLPCRAPAATAYQLPALALLGGERRRPVSWPHLRALVLLGPPPESSRAPGPAVDLLTEDRRFRRSSASSFSLRKSSRSVLSSRISVPICAFTSSIRRSPAFSSSISALALESAASAASARRMAPISRSVVRSLSSSMRERSRSSSFSRAALCACAVRIDASSRLSSQASVRTSPSSLCISVWAPRSSAWASMSCSTFCRWPT
mmetsp:Transcript_26571/g.84289  ORF Transcript_26571/g.84289 Transcript_26571/m.84289 type:complete len:205 (-) Transcript_26571:428-1042(-)